MRATILNVDRSEYRYLKLTNNHKSGIIQILINLKYFFPTKMQWYHFPLNNWVYCE